MKDNPFISVVIPVYNEEKNIQPLLERLLPVVKKHAYEILFVNDGSSDDTEKEIKKQAKSNKNIKLISFVRNFSQQMAFTAGYEYALGDLVITMDADLQDPPELIDDMIKKWKEGARIVYAKREVRNESFFKTFTADIFYIIINKLSPTHIPINVGDFRLIDREVANTLNAMPERFRFLRGLVAWGGYDAEYVSFERNERTHGVTHYPLSKMIAFALNGIISFSTKPLRAATYLGVISALLGFTGILYALYRRLFLPHEFWVTGWTTIFIGIMFFGGVQLLTIGIIGEYIGKIYSEIQGRPKYLIKEKINIS